jgi:hypothetical protein
VVKNDYPGAGSVQYVLPNENDIERNEPTTNERISSNNLSNRKTFCFADSADSSVNRDIPIARNAAKDEANRRIVKGSDDITEKALNV